MHKIKMSRKGQVTIPKAIRTAVGIRPADELFIEIVDGKIVLERIPTLDEVMGIFKVNRHITKEEMKQSVMDAIYDKFKGKLY